MRFLLVSSLMLLLACAGFYAWISTEPRSIPSLNPYIEKSLNKGLPGYYFHIKNNIIQWDSEKNSLELSIQDVSVEDAQNQAVATLPQVKIDLTLAYLFIGRIKPMDVVVFNPAFKIALGGDKPAIENGDLYKKITEKLLVLGKLRPEEAALQNINIRDADILVNTPQKDILVHIQNTYTTFEHKEGILHINNRIYATVETHPVSFETNFSFLDQETALLECNFKDVRSATLNDIFPDNEIIKNLNLILNGNVRVKLKKDALPIVEHFAFNNISGSFSHPKYFIEPLNIKTLSLRGSIEPDYSQLTVDTMDADFGGATLHVSGFIKQKDKAIKEIVLDANAANVPIDDIRLYWPSGIIGAPARDWVVQRISKGIVPKAYAKLWVSEDDIAQKHLSDNSLEARVDFVDGEVNYFDAYPPATNVNGTARFTGKGMDIAISQGTILNSNVTNASVTIDNFKQHPATINITGEATGIPSDLTAYFDVNKINTILSTELQKLDGTTTTDVNLSIPLIHPVTLGDMTIDIISNTQNTSLPKLFGKYDVTKGDVRLSFNGSTLYIDGKSQVNDVPVAFSSATNLPKQGETTFDGKYNIKGTLTPTSQKALLLPDVASFTGEAPFELVISDTKGIRKYQLSANLDNAGISLENLGWTKATGEKMQVDISASQTSGNQLQVSQLKASSPTIQISGNGQIQSDFSAINSLNITTLRFGNNDLSVNYSQTSTARKWDIQGNSVDLSQARFGKLFTSSANGKEKALQVAINLRKVIMKNDEIFTNAVGNVSCYSGLCQSGSLKSGVGKDGTLALQLKPGEGKSGLNLESNRANSIAKALDIYSNMQGGRLYLDAEFSKAPAQENQPAHNVIEGLLRIENFRAMKTPILAKIATLASFEGITSLLENKGIKFKRLYAPFRFEHETIYLKDAKAYGESLGVTTKGRIYTSNETLNLNGTFVPSYTVNNILGKLPVVGAIGDVLMGGKGEGILAVRYKVEGPYDNANVTVNPLSILTPGFLRNLFDIVDLIIPESNQDLGKIEPAYGKDTTKPSIPPARDQGSATNTR